MTEPTVTKIAPLTWAVMIDGAEKGIVSQFSIRGYSFFCHSLLVKRGARFSTLAKAVADLAQRAA